MINVKNVEISEEKIIDDSSTVSILRKLQLTAVVQGNEVTNPFVVVETYGKNGKGDWLQISTTYTRIAIEYNDYHI